MPVVIVTVGIVLETPEVHAVGQERSVHRHVGLTDVEEGGAGRGGCPRQALNLLRSGVSRRMHMLYRVDYLTCNF